MGIGKKLFSLVCKKAKEMGAQRLYISAHSSQETQAFYKAMGCVEAMEYSDKLVAEEPCDCQLEYKLFKQTK
jgi:N-acetylglutamate synthase-like GNAT family acetyltransferase